MFFKIRLVKKEDVKNIFDLANDLIVRQNSFHPEFISWQDHVKWFEEKITSKNCIFYIIEDQENNFIGQVRFDKILRDQDVYLIGISIAEEFRGKGLGSLILKEVSNKLIKDYKARKIIAHIKEDNKVSIRSFLSVGYNFIAKDFFEQTSFMKFEYKSY
ncbi:GNAT family N-acetyltransferase [Candidatus Babeliales bacterium]|nr:GNAT family N-acetyltransferase [Candidatus Babeliales bacterium]